MKYEVFGVPVDDITLEEASDRVEKMLRSGRSHAVCYANAETLVHASKNAGLCDALSDADMVFPDGFGLRFFGKYAGAPIRSRVAGLDLMLRVCENAERAGISVFLFGARNNVAYRASLVLRKKYPKLRISGVRDGFEGMKGWESDAGMSEAGIIFVALGTPLQERWVVKYARRLPHARVALAVGGAFDMLAGITPRAPKYVRAIGFEWLWRFLLEPVKRGKRVANAVLVFPTKLILQKKKS